MYAVDMDAETRIRKPTLLLVSGAPGSGKTTLAKLLSQKMGLYHIERDRLKFGVEFGKKTSPQERVNTVVPVYFKILATIIDLGVSCIADGAHFRGKTEKDLTYFRSRAIVLNIHCRTTDAIKRAKERDQERDETNPDWSVDYKPDYEVIYKDTAHPVNHGYSILEVDCTKDYQPNLDSIVQWVYEQIELESDSGRRLG